jgi:hypothetical protein
MKDVLRDELFRAFREYEALRTGADLWKFCMGKQVVKPVANILGFATAEVLERNVLHLWKSNEIMVPPEVDALRKYMKSL